MFYSIKSDHCASVFFRTPPRGGVPQDVQPKPQKATPARRSSCEPTLGNPVTPRATVRIGVFAVLDHDDAVVADVQLPE